MVAVVVVVVVVGVAATVVAAVVVAAAVVVVAVAVAAVFNFLNANRLRNPHARLRPLAMALSFLALPRGSHGPWHTSTHAHSCTAHRFLMAMV